MSIYRVPVVTCRLTRERALLVSESPIIGGAADAARILHAYLEGADRETFVVLLLNTRHRVVGINTVTVGGLALASVHAREVFKPAIVNDPPAAAIILGHNHPSGDLTPSRHDELLTERLRAAGELLDIKVLDHIIVTPTGDYAKVEPEGR